MATALLKPGWRGLALALLGLLGALLLPQPARARGSHEPSRRQLPHKYRRSPYSLMSLSVGAPQHGYQLRAKRLRRSRYLKIKKGSGRRVYALPALVLMLERSSREVGELGGGAVMLVGDLSSKHGGPLSGHASHQSGRDADVGFYVVDRHGRSVLLRHFVKMRSDGSAVGRKDVRFDDYRNWLLVRSWLRDRRAGLWRVFVERSLRARLLEYGRRHARFRRYVTEAAFLLAQPTDAAPHDDHFHVRIACPARQRPLCHD